MLDVHTAFEFSTIKYDIDDDDDDDDDSDDDDDIFFLRSALL